MVFWVHFEKNQFENRTPLLLQEVFFMLTQKLGWQSFLLWWQAGSSPPCSSAPGELMSLLFYLVFLAPKLIQTEYKIAFISIIFNSDFLKFPCSPACHGLLSVPIISRCPWCCYSRNTQTCSTDADVTSSAEVVQSRWSSVTGGVGDCYI